MPDAAIGSEAVIVTTQQEIERVLTEWDRRYRENPEQFQNEAARLLDPNETPETYGGRAAPYFVHLMGELRG